MKKINMDTIVQHPDPILRQKSKEVSFPLQKEDKEIMESLLKYVRDSRDEDLAEQQNLQPAVGIAAPQIGVLKQMTAIVVDLPNKNGEIETIEYALINPKIVSHSVKKIALGTGEGCLSVRDFHEGYVPRYKRIRVQAYDLLQNKEIDLRVHGYLSIIMQHELDHLHGVLYFDHINKENPWFQGDFEVIE